MSSDIHLCFSTALRDCHEPHSVHARDEWTFAQMELEHEEPHGSRPEYTESPWVDLHTFQPSSHPSPTPEYNGFGFLHTPHGLVTEPPLNHMNPSMAPMQSLRPLVMPPWPSTLTSQPNYVPPLLPTLPLSTPLSASSSHATASTSAPRRTLTDEDRRRMCLYHEEHPTVKQTEIGGKLNREDCSWSC